MEEKERKKKQKKGRGETGNSTGRQKRKLFRKAAVASTEIGMISRGSHQCIASFLHTEKMFCDTGTSCSATQLLGHPQS